MRQRAAWQAGHLDAETRELLADDARYFLHQSLSTPCLNVLDSADGAWITNRSTWARVWTPDLEMTDPAGGAEKNRGFEGDSEKRQKKRQKKRPGGRPRSAWRLEAGPAAPIFRKEVRS